MKTKLSEEKWKHINQGLGFGGPVLNRFHRGSLKDRPFEIMEQLFYVSKNGLEVVLQPPYRTDFASIPTFFHRIFNPIGDHGHAAFIHDWLCDVSPKVCSSQEAADIFLECMELLDVNPVKRKVMTRAVRIAGPKFKKGDE